MIRSGSIVCGLIVILAGTEPAAGQVTSRVTVSSAGAQGDADSYPTAISADGRYVAFFSYADNLVAGDTNATYDVFVRDRHSGTTERVSVDSSGAQGNGASLAPAISGDGRFVVFLSLASNLVAGDTNGVTDVFVHDLQTGTTERVSLDSAGVEGNGYCYSATISDDGRIVAFQSYSTNLVAGDTNGVGDAFVRDRLNGTTERVSVDSAGAQGNADSYAPWISGDGRYAAFASYATNLVAGDTNGAQDVFLRDRLNGTTELVSLGSSGAQGNADSYFPLLSADGRTLAFYSAADDFAAGDTNGTYDGFVRDLAYSPFTSSCFPGVAGVIACPCSNPPSAPGRGCDNSSATGGAILSASGIAYLSQDTLVFTTSGEKPTATSIVLQGTGSLSSGTTYGQGVRCVAGSLHRLFTKAASGGSITAPNFGAGDPTVSVRSAARGDVIGPGQSRFYLVYYRDPTVLGGCPASSTFNATQSGRIDWSP